MNKKFILGCIVGYYIGFYAAAALIVYRGSDNNYISSIKSYMKTVRDKVNAVLHD
jgi:hypothetical protein